MARSRLTVPLVFAVLTLCGCQSDRRNDASIDTSTLTPGTQGSEAPVVPNDTGQIPIAPVASPPPPAPPPAPPNDSGQIQPSINLKARRPIANDSGQISGVDTKRKRQR